MTNKIIKKISIFALSAALGLGISGCGALDMLGISTKKEEKKEVTEQKVKEKTEAPTITADLSGSITYGLNQEATPVFVEASVNDGGTLVYQWYKNTTNSNGGGTPIENATGKEYKPSTAEVGKLYYYVVVGNASADDSKNPGMTTSQTLEVIVQEGEAAAAPAEATQQTQEQEVQAQAAAQAQAAEEAKRAQETKAGSWEDTAEGKMFRHDDGTYATGEWKEINGQRFHFDGNGILQTSWFTDTDGATYYLSTQDGHMIVDFDVDGRHLGSDGKATS
ncbi:MAG TPA: hypothetical protein VIR32_06965 [Lachnospiraceae bacterium]